jgi:hypothetical protein
MSDDQEEKNRQEILQIRMEHKRLSDMIHQGTQYHESVTVRCIDGQEHLVDVYAISDEQIRIAFEDAGVEVKDLRDPKALFENLKLPQKLKMFAAISAAATRDPKISEVLLPLQTATIAQKALELSGFGAGPKTESSASSEASTQPR